MLKKSAMWAMRVGVALLATLALTVALAAAVGRFWLAEHLEEFRPRIEALISEEAKVDAHIESISLAWHGLEPEFLLKNTRLKGADGRVDLTLDEVRVTPSLWAALFRDIELSSLTIEHPFITVEKTEGGRYRVAGVEIPESPNEPGVPFIDWLFRQHEIAIRDGSIRFQDLERHTPSVLFTAVNLSFKKSFGRHQVQLTAAAPEDMVQGASLEGSVRAGSTLDLSSWSGDVRGRFNYLDLEKLRSVLPIPARFTGARGALSYGLQFKAGAITQFQMDSKLDTVSLVLDEGLAPLRFAEMTGFVSFKKDGAAITLETKNLLARPDGVAKDLMRPANFKWVAGPSGGQVSVDTVYLGPLTELIEGLPVPDRIRQGVKSTTPTGVLTEVSGHWQGPLDHPSSFDLGARLQDVSVGAMEALPGLTHVSGQFKASDEGGEAKLTMIGGMLHLPHYYDHALSVPRFELSTHWVKKSEGTMVTIDRGQLESPDYAGDIEGTIKIDQEGHRIAALTATIDRAQLNSIATFLPTSDVGPDTRHWVEQAFKQGLARHATMELKGDLHDFPFRARGTGVFKVRVPVEGVSLSVGPGWPLLTEVKGSVNFEGVGLKLQVAGAKSMELNAREIVGSIEDLDADEPELLIQGRLTGPIQSGFDFIDQSPLKSRLHGLTKTFRARGQAGVGLGLRVPLNHADDTRVDGEILVDGAELKNDAGDIPPISQIKGRLHFTDEILKADDVSLKVLGGLTHIKMTPGPQNEIQMEGRGVAEVAEALQFYGVTGLEFIHGKSNWVGQFALKEGELVMTIAADVPVFGQVSSLKVTRELGRGITVDAHGRTTSKALVDEFVPVLSPVAEDGADWAVLWRKGASNEGVSGGGHFRLFGKPGSFSVSGKSDAITVDIEGGVLGQDLGKIFPIPRGMVSGSSGWKASVDTRGGKTESRFTSDLKGLKVEMPPPFGKAAAEVANFGFRVSKSGKTSVLKGRWDGRASFALQLPTSANGTVSRAEVRVGDGNLPEAPEVDKILITGEFPEFSVDAWKTWLKDHPAPESKKEGGAKDSQEILLDVGVKEARMGRYIFGAHHATGRILQSASTIQVRGPEFEGDIDWQDAGSGHLTLKMNHLALKAPDEPKTQSPQPNQADPKTMPTVDFSAATMELGRYKFVQVAMHGEPDSEGWKVSKLSLAAAHGAIQGQGRWAGKPGQSRTSLAFELNSPDTGLFMQDIGYAKVLSQGKTKLKGQIDWPGDLTDFSFTGFDGGLDLDCQSGQFLNAEPGVGRLIGLISLQSLPRRITLDFKDIFSQGFAFDSLMGHIDAKQGVLSTQDLVMQGPAAKVGIQGSADLGPETANLHVRVAPAVGNSVSFATTLLGGPAVGAATWLFQKIFKDPLGQILMYEYDITGPWDDPVVKSLGKKKSGEDKKS